MHLIMINMYTPEIGQRGFTGNNRVPAHAVPVPRAPKFSVRWVSRSGRWRIWPLGASSCTQISAPLFRGARRQLLRLRGRWQPGPSVCRGAWGCDMSRPVPARWDTGHSRRSALGGGARCDVWALPIQLLLSHSGWYETLISLNFSFKSRCCQITLCKAAVVFKVK